MGIISGFPRNATVSQLGAVPESRTVNGHALDEDIVLSAGDLDAEIGSKQVAVTLLASGWVGDAAPYTQEVAVEGMTPELSGDIAVAPIADDEQRVLIREVVGAAQISVIEQGEGTITVVADGEKPTEDVPVLVTMFVPSNDLTTDEVLASLDGIKSEFNEHVTDPDAHTDIRTALNDLNTTVDGKSDSGHTHTATEVGADAAGTAISAVSSHNTSSSAHIDIRDAITSATDTAKSYTDTKIAGLISGAPTTMDTLGEIAALMEENEDVVTALDTAIGQKADKTYVDEAIATAINGAMEASY